MDIKLTDIDFINKLIAEKTPESNTIEYKLQLNIAKEGDKKEFLADISSFANSNGGVIYFGIKEEKSVPISIEGIEIENIDATIMQIESIIRDGIKPRISGITTEILDHKDAKKVIVIKVPQSFDAPHQVIFARLDKFWGRATNSKFSMDSIQIEKAINTKNILKEGLKSLKKERLDLILSGETPVILLPNPKVILQIIPSSCILTDKKFDLSNPVYQAKELKPLGGGSRTPKIIFDGVLVYAVLPSGGDKPSYLLASKNGMIETVNALMISQNPKMLYMQRIEGYLIREIESYLSYYKRLNIDIPIFLSLTITGIRGFELYSEKIHYVFNKTHLEMDVLKLETLSITGFDSNAASILRPWFDSIWNAFGFEKSYHFDENNKWIYNTDFIY